MYDSLLINRARAREKSTVLERLALAPRSYGVVTVHRAENTDDMGRLEQLLMAFNRIASEDLSLVFPVHPRTAALLKTRFAQWRPHARLRLVEPLGYLDMLRLVDDARIVLTDSGGLQKEAFFLDCPCVTLRDETEWVETVEGGGNVLAGTAPDRIVAAVAAWRQRYPQGKANFRSAVAAAFGDGHAADKIMQSLLAFHANRKARAESGGQAGGS
jgi:UDP-N-acetylglucosamine 2-epimerase